MAPDESPQYLIVGHLSQDRNEDGVRLGGTAAYSGLTAAALGFRVGLVTSGPMELMRLLPSEILTRCLASKEATSFENRYESGHRSQRLLARARDLGMGDVPPDWASPLVLHLAPIADEVDPALAEAFPGSLVALTPQGWLRRWDGQGRVGRKDWGDFEETLPAADVTILSEEDVESNPEWIRQLAQKYPKFVVTRGADGAIVYSEGMPVHVPAPRADEVDPTGSGDIFAAAFLFHYHHHQDLVPAARFANQLAARSVERHGINGTPTPSEARIARKQALQ